VRARGIVIIRETESVMSIEPTSVGVSASIGFVKYAFHRILLAFVSKLLFQLNFEVDLFHKSCE